MHEAGLMEAALELALERTRAAGGTRIHRMILSVGASSGVVSEALQFAFLALSRHGPAEGATMEVVTVPVRHWCEPCRSEFADPGMASKCPRCGTTSHDMRSGLELELTSLEIS